MPNKTRCEQRSGGLTITLVFSRPAPALFGQGSRMKKQNKTAGDRKRRGRPAKPLEVEIEFIHTEDASERWGQDF
jgi:hypothetical protein